MRRIAALLVALTLCPSLLASEQVKGYSFISGDDLYDALSQDSMLLQGYILGVTDSLKHSANSAECFTVPLQPDADLLIYSGYINYWSNRTPRPDNAVTAILQMMLNQFPCNTSKLK